MLDALFPLFYENLQDNIPSVRQGAALAISNVCMAYGMSKRVATQCHCVLCTV